MKELIKLVDEHFFDKKELNEAGIDPDKIWKEKLKNELSDPALNQPTAPEWNKLYIKYANEKAPSYSIIKVTNLIRKTDKEKKESGYLKYEEDTGKSKILKVDTIESGKLQVVEEPDQATVFTPDEAQSFIKAVKRNSDFDLRQAAFAPERTTASTSASSSAAGTILKAFFEKLCGVNNGTAALWIRNAMNVLVGMCSSRTYPLVGNPLLDVLANAFDVDEVRANFKPDDNKITKLNNLLSKGEVSIATLRKLDTFKGVIFFNNNLYKYDIPQIQKLFDYYEKAWSIKADDVDNQELKSICETDHHQIAKHLLMIQGDDASQDYFQHIIFNTARDTGDMLPFEYLGATVKANDGNLLKWPIRNPESVDVILNRINERGASESESNKDFFLQILIGDSIESKRSTGNVDGEGADVVFNNITLPRDSKLRLIYTYESNRDSQRAENLFRSNLKNIITRNNLDRYFKANDDGTILVLTDLENCLLEAKLDREATFGRGDTFKLLNISLNLTARPEETPAEEGQPENPTEPETTETVPEGYYEVEPDGNTNGDVQENVSVQVDDKVVGLNGERMDVTAENIGPEGKWNIKAGTKIWRKVPEQTEQPIDNQLRIAGKTLDELAKMSKEDFNTWKNGLSKEDKNHLLTIGRRLMTFATAK